ncbi:ATP-binding cassette domain-containing protein [Thiomonas intermedia]|uniref:ATP-binding cassette domain-containing protein n=1 Tax=Thiomonas intermedia TaxID=926 RepID=UPI0009A4E535|nr:ATP-binding cassette domain-containing protein [Thiomonas intermedia]
MKQIATFTPTADPLITLERVSLIRHGKPLLEDVSLRVLPRQIVTLIGPNGAGKTTLVRVLLGLLAPDGGRVRRMHRLKVGYVPQRFTVPPSLPMDVNDFLRLSGASTAARRQQVLDDNGAGDLLQRPLRALSGGEMQRVLLARAMLRQPELLVLDEPAQSLDVQGQQSFYALIVRLRDATGCGVLLVSHDLHLVMAATDEVICLERHVCCAGRPEDIGVHPEYLRLFGRDLAGLAVYRHHHDHHHDLHGSIVPDVAQDGAPGEHRHE